MGFFDLNIPYRESDRHATDKHSLRGRRLKLALKAMELGYTGVAYNRTLSGVMSESDRCSTVLFPISKLTPSSSAFFASVKFHRELLNVAAKAPFRQYTRLTVVVDSPSQASALNSGNPVLKSYDIVAVRPRSQIAFDHVCDTSEVDMIAIDFTKEMLPFRLKQPKVKAAIKRGVYFEITYNGLIADSESKRRMISNCKLLVDWTRGKNIIICSAALSATDLRGPQDVANLFFLLGLSRDRAKAAISSNCRSLLANALRKRHFYKEAVKVEKIPSDGQSNLAKSMFDDWLTWDPISSGQGDVLLDDMERSFSMPQTVKENVKTINFTSNLNGMPSHGFQIKDLIPVTKSALEPPEADKLALPVMETEVDASDEKCEEQGGLNTLHEEQHSLLKMEDSLSNLSNDHGGVVELREGRLSSFGATNIYHNSDCQDSKVPSGYVPETKPALLPLPGHDQVSDDVAKIEFRVSGLGDSSVLSLPTLSVRSTDPEEITQISNKLEANDSDDMEENIVASETLLQDAPFQVDQGNCSHGAGQVHITRINTHTPNNHVSIELSNPLNSSSSSVFPLIPTMENPLEMGDGSPLKGSLNLTTNFHEPMNDDEMAELKHIESVTDYQGLSKSQAGMNKRKGKSLHQPFLFPFKRSLKSRPSKKKSRK